MLPPVIKGLKFSLSSFWLSRNFTDKTDFVTWLSTLNFVLLRSECFLILLLAIYQGLLASYLFWTFLLQYCYRTLNYLSGWKLFTHAGSVLSSTKLWIVENLIKKNRLLTDKLKRIGPTIEPCDTPGMISSKLVYLLFIRTHCFRYFKWECDLIPRSYRLDRKPLIWQ